MEKAMSRPEREVQTARQWLSGLAVTLTTIVSYIGFARISVKWTLVVAICIIIGLLTFLWIMGGRKER